MDNQIQENKEKKTGLICRIIFLGGIIVSACALFMPAKEEDILEGQAVQNLFSAFTGKNPDGVNYINMLFGHSIENLIGMPPLLLEILTFFLPVALVIAAAVMVFLAPKKMLGLVLGLIGTVMLLGRDIYLMLTDTGFFGIYMNATGVVIAIIALLMLYMDRSDEGEYIVAGVITCRTGTFAGSSFDVADQVVIGKNPRECNIVLNNRTISRKHCIIKYLPDSDSYTVKDVSSNGTFLGDGRRFAKNYEAHVERGTEIYMGDPRETFYLD